MQIANVEIKHPEKILFPDDDISKFDVIQYYYLNQDKILPELKDRPVSLVRSPGGIGEGKFYQKHPGENFPDYIQRVKIQEKEEVDVYILIDEPSDLVYLANLGVIEFHTWGSKYPDVEKPDRIIFDLDPSPEVEWKNMRKAAMIVREYLDALGYESTLKTSGNKGLHVITTPKKSQNTWTEVKGFSHEVAKHLTEKHPDLFTLEMRKADRTGHIFLDYLRNDRGATAVAAYSLRARASAPVALPITWEQLDSVESSDQWTLKDFV